MYSYPRLAKDYWTTWLRIFFSGRFKGPYPVLVINGYVIPLLPKTEIKMSTIVTVGHKLAFAIKYFDQNGNPMLTTPTPDSASWSNTNPAAETLTPASNGQSATATAIAAGTDEIDLTVVVGGNTFKASLAVEVDPAPQVLTSVAIDATVE